MVKAAVLKVMLGFILLLIQHQMLLILSESLSAIQGYKDPDLTSC